MGYLLIPIWGPILSCASRASSDEHGFVLAVRFFIFMDI